MLTYAANMQASNCCRIEDKDFRTEFGEKRWTVEWNCNGEPSVLKKKLGVTRVL